MKKDIQELLERVLESMGLEETVNPQVTVPENPDHGDYTTNVAMLLSKQLNKSPVNIAEDLKEMVQKDQTISRAGIVDRVEIARPGFINIYLSEAKLISQIQEVLKKGNAYGRVTNSPSQKVLGADSKPKKTLRKGKKTDEIIGGSTDNQKSSKNGKKETQISRKNAAQQNMARQDKKNQSLGSSDIIPESSKKRVMIEFADPNPFKEIHIGHVRNIALGESFCRLLEFQGHDVRRANYEGDVGMHVAKALWALQKGESFEKAYAVGSTAFEAQEQAKKEIVALNKKIYDKDASIMDLYKKGRQWSLDRFEVIYGRLGTHFDRYYFESEVAPFGVKIVEDHPDVFELSDGAFVYRGEKVGLHTRVFVTKEHYATYEAKDLALAPLKYSEWPYDLSIIMTGNEQAEYFKVMLAALAEINPDLAAKTRHISFGMVRLTTGKMSSRTGDVITAEWLIEEAKKRIYIILDTNKTNYDKKQKDAIAEKAAVAAIKYSMLRVNSISDIAFDLEASVSFDGDSGPYLQYTYARCQSVLRKAKKSKVDHAQVENDKLNQEERMLARSIMQFSDVVAEAALHFAPNTIATYLFHLAQQFNLFYAHNPILGDKKRLALTAATAQVVKNGLYLLGIEVLEEM